MPVCERAIKPLPPSAKCVRSELRHAGPLSWAALKRHTLLSDSTLNDGLAALDAAGALECRSRDSEDQYALTESAPEG